MTKYAALYIRVSTDDQLEFSPDAQRKALLKYANANGYTVHESHIFIDEGISGRKAEKRPAFMEMVAQAKSANKPFSFILVHKFDRFARSREDSVVYKSLLKKECDIKVISITESMEDDKFSIILEAMLEAMAEYYSINLSEEVKKGMTEKALRGGLQTSPSFGYRALGNKLMPIEEEANFVHEIFRRFISGDGFYTIAKWLNDMGAKTHRGNKFEARTVEYIIRNPVYIGKLRWNPVQKTGRDYHSEHIILAESEHKAIIDMDTWAMAQKRADEIKTQWKHKKRPVSEHKDWLSGIIRCADCACTLIFSKPHYWKCNGYAKGSCKSSQHIRDDLIKEALLRQLDEDTKTSTKISYKELHLTGGTLDEISSLKLQATKLERKLERLRHAYLDGIETIEAYQKSKQSLEDALLEVNQKIKDASGRTADEHTTTDIHHALRGLVSILSSDNTTTSAKHNALAAMINTCTFSKAENLLEIEYRYIDTAMPPA